MSKHVLNTKNRSEEVEAFDTELRSRIVGQDAAVDSLADLYESFRAGLQEHGRTVGNLLFAGPTGCGKTATVEVAAEILFKDRRAVIKVDCAEFQHSHEIAKLIGSPPGYLGHRETHPLITQEELARFHKENLKLSFLLFDEIEKASDSLWNLLLGMLDRATLTLGDNRRVDLSHVVIFMTSNVGGSSIAELMTGGYGFVEAEDKTSEGVDKKVEHTVIEAARRKFLPEFVNRLDKVVVFRALDRPQLERVLDIELGKLQQRIFDAMTGKFLFRLSPSAREFLLREGTDLRYGARHLKRAIERNIVHPLAKLIGTSQINDGDVLEIDFAGGELQFSVDVKMEIVKVGVPFAAAASAGSYA
jgi:ATP-dependent Clp protease ATP-binding subunit ClpB